MQTKTTRHPARDEAAALTGMRPAELVLLSMPLPSGGTYHVYARRSDAGALQRVGAQIAVAPPTTLKPLHVFDVYEVDADDMAVLATVPRGMAPPQGGRRIAGPGVALCT